MPGVLQRNAATRPHSCHTRCARCPLQSPEFARWFAEAGSWLRPYAAFCFLRDLFGTAEHWQWGALATPSPQVRNPSIPNCTPSPPRRPVYAPWIL